MELHRHGVRGRERPPRPGAGARTAVGGGGRAGRPGHRFGVGSRAPARHPASGREAAEHPARRRRHGSPHRLRLGEAGRPGRDHRHRWPGWYAGLRGTRGARGAPRRRPGRHLRAGSHALLRAHRRAARSAVGPSSAVAGAGRISARGRSTRVSRMAGRRHRPHDRRLRRGPLPDGRGARRGAARDRRRGGSRSGSTVPALRQRRSARARALSLLRRRAGWGGRDAHLSPTAVQPGRTPHRSGAPWRAASRSRGGRGTCRRPGGASPLSGSRRRGRHE